ncbi:MAG: ribonuclease Z [Methanobrevibacter sp.]|jgi:ribonuclease Z|nr:ribonuclease Z [Methanobrevibacter sp.]
MEIIFLGTSSAVPTLERNHPSIALRAFAEVMLFDCGEGTQRQLIEAKISPMKITKIFISHFHGDHILGLGGLIQSLGFRGREKDLDIYGPKGLHKIINAISSFGYFQINYNLNIHEIQDGTVIETEDYVVECAKVEHNIPSYAYSIREKKKPLFLREKAEELGIPPGPLYGKLHNGEEVEFEGRIIKPEQVLGEAKKGKKISYSGDTRPCEAMIRLARDSDILIHESTYEAEDYQRAVDNAHSTSVEAAEIAREANVNELVLTHISTRYTSDENIKSEAQKVFKNTKVARDYMKIDL